jgi:ATP-dependent Clp protease ATP-binding subunit ClpB
MLNDLNKRLQESYYSFEFSDALKDYILDRSFSMTYGARPIKRFIQNNVETLLANEIVQGNIDTKHKYLVDYKDKVFIKEL